MKIYIVNFADQDFYCAYTSFEKAKQVLWENYCEEVSNETRAKFLEDDLKTLEEGYIIDYGWIAVTDLVEE